MAIKIQDKVELEEIIDQYLMDDIPLSLLTETYDLTYPQIQLLINRTIGFTRQKERLLDNNPELSYNDIPQDILSIPHNVKEEYPRTYEEVVELFKRLDEIKQILTSPIEEEHKRLTASYEAQQNKLAQYDYDIIKRIESFLGELKENMDSDTVAETLFRNGIGMRDLQPFNEIYQAYTEDQKRLVSIAQELNACETSLQNYRSQKKKLEYEYEDIRETLTVCNIKLVNWCIRRFFNNIPLVKEETQLYGLEALAIAINEFDYKLGFRFSTYAVPVIVHHIERHFQELYGMSWDNFTKKESIRYYRRLMRENNPDLKRDPTPQELADLGLISLNARQIANSDELIDDIVPMSSVYPPMSSDYPETRRYEMPETFEDYELIDDYEDSYSIPSSSESIDDTVLNSFSKEAIREVLKELTPREEAVLKMRFGLENNSPMTLKEVGKHFNITREYIRQIEAKALRKLRHPSRANRIRGYYYDTGYKSSSSKPQAHPNIYLYKKLISLLKLSKSQESILLFMNLDGLGWDTEKMNEYITNLYITCDYIKKGKHQKDNPHDLAYLIPGNASYYPDFIPPEVVAVLQSQLEYIIAVIESYYQRSNIDISSKSRKK